jgi:hypothetical protein
MVNSFLHVFIFCIFLIKTPYAVASDFLNDLLRCQASRTLTQQTKSGEVFLRTFPFGFQSLSTIQDETPLASVLASNAIEAQLYEHLQKYSEPKSIAGGDRPVNKNAVNLFLRASDTTPNGVLIKRANEITIFPRSFLAYPRIALVAIRDGDAVATFWAEQTAKKDAFYSSLIESRRLSTKLVKSITVPQFIEKENGNFIASWNKNLNNLNLFQLTSLQGNEDILQSQRGNITIPYFPIYVVQRRQGSFLLNFVVPLLGFGPFSAEGYIFRSLYSDSNDRTIELATWKRRWIDTYKGFQDLTLADGDIIHFTDLRALSLFREIVY